MENATVYVQQDSKIQLLKGGYVTEPIKSTHKNTVVRDPKSMYPTTTAPRNTNSHVFRYKERDNSTADRPVKTGTLTTEVCTGEKIATTDTDRPSTMASSTKHPTEK
jgi:DNA polymerase elongation subunit (family B)